MLVVSSPSGVGKTSLSRRLVADHPDLELSTSCTTRPPRPGEQDGREYHFVDRPRFDEMVAADAFLEWAEYHDNRYGSPAEPVMRALGAGHDVLFDIDWQGALNIAAYAPEDTVLVYILPPSLAEMARRIRARAADTQEVIEGRLGRAKDEMAKWNEYHYVLVNDDFDRAYAELAHVYHAERLRRARNEWLDPFVQELLAEPL
jgi:guanylate kinase